MKRTIILQFLLTLVAGNLPAELPPWAYKEQQSKAPEALVVKVRSVATHETKEARAKRTDFTMEAEVQKVERSATKLAPGAIIKIIYNRREYFEPLVGPSEIPALKEGQVCPAYLSGDGKTYSPAAGGYSFETVR